MAALRGNLYVADLKVRHRETNATIPLFLTTAAGTPITSVLGTFSITFIKPDWTTLGPYTTWPTHVSNGIWKYTLNSFITNGPEGDWRFYCGASGVSYQEYPGNFLMDGAYEVDVAVTWSLGGSGQRILRCMASIYRWFAPQELLTYSPSWTGYTTLSQFDVKLCDEATGTPLASFTKSDFAEIPASPGTVVAAKTMTGGLGRQCVLVSVDLTHGGASRNFRIAVPARFVA